ncbi:glutathione S-transferase [Fistulina hepatica ATCC 64428]|uniref:glutathione transferase n=1 Tax=Fistulina hepatica ATCC 64428 TaxID=1128425 RepID=A0A0D7AQ14_9AGAR|nr:glutathione S-transferase [Fistulina hepatica ATCC 64428]
MVLKLYGSVLSTCTPLVAIILLEKRIPFEFIEVGQGEFIKTPEYKAKQPFGQVPYIDDDGFILYESRAIARYICEKYPDQGPKLIPDAPKQRALFEQAASTELYSFDPYARSVVIERYIKQFRKQEPDQHFASVMLETLEQKMDAYEAILSKHKYVAGDNLTLADLFHIPYGLLLPPAGCNILISPEKRPNVARWFKEISSRPAARAIWGPQGYVIPASLEEGLKLLNEQKQAE